MGPQLGYVVRITPIYKPFNETAMNGRGSHNPRSWGLTITMVINHVSVRHGMILQDGIAKELCTWMSQTGSERINGERISGLVHPKEYPNWMILQIH